MGAFSRPQPKSRFFQKSGIKLERSEIEMKLDWGFQEKSIGWRPRLTVEPICKNTSIHQLNFRTFWVSAHHGTEGLRRIVDGYERLRQRLGGRD